MVDAKRVILLVLLAYVSILLWNAWQKDYPPQQSVQVVEHQPKQKVDGETGTIVPRLPSQQHKSSAVKNSNVAHYPSTTIPHNRIITVHTGTMNIEIDTQGGNIVKVSLPKYPNALKTPDIPFTLLNNERDSFYVAQSGLTGTDGPDTPKGQVKYTATQKRYNMAPGKKELQVPLTWQNDKGIKVTKLFTFTEGRYVVKVSYKIANQSAKTWSGHFYGQIQRKKNGAGQSHSLIHSYTGYTGASISSPEKHYEKLTYKDLDKENLNRSIRGGWLAMQQHYFLSAWIPAPQQSNHYFSRVSDDNIYTLGFIGPKISVPAGDTTIVKAKFYAGPEEINRLETIAPQLKLTVDYGWIYFISIIIFWILSHIHSLVGNWGWSIVLVTFTIRLIFYKLSVTAYRSMAKMRRLQPRIQILKERYGDDKQKFSKAIMDLYRKEKANPLGGCLPILIQIPVFIGLYWVLIESVELRQAPFMLWIHDLAAPDPYFILPVLMGGTMLLLQKLSPPPPDPMQAKVMMFLPVFFTFLFLYFPAGLVLYWVTNNILSIAQQWYVMRMVDKEYEAKEQNKPKTKKLAAKRK